MRSTCRAERGRRLMLFVVFGVALLAGWALPLRARADTTLQFTELAHQDANPSGYIPIIQPGGTAIDGDGNTYVADTSNHRIVKLSAAGAVLAIWGTQGSGSGQFVAPNDVAVDAGGIVYVADSNNSRIVKLSSAGAVLATWGTYGTGSGQFNYPRGVAVDADGTVYVADTGNNRIVKLSSAGAVLATWGTEGSGSGQFSFPRGVAVDAGGNIFVADTSNSRIVKLSSAGAVLVTWGNFAAPFGVVVDAGGTVYVADSNNHRIVKLSSAGAVLATWGTYGTGSGQFKSPSGVAVDADGNIYVVDTSNNRIVKLSSAGETLATWGNFYYYLQGVGIDAGGTVYVADSNNHRIVKLSSAGAVLATWGTYGTGSGQFRGPHGVAVDASGIVYVADTDNSRIVKLSSAGAVLATWGTWGTGSGQFSSPCGVAVDADGTVYVADTSNHRIVKLSSAGAVLATWSGFYTPFGVTLDAGGNIYVADTNNNRIVKLSSAGAVLTTWGTYGTGGGQFQFPHGVAVDTGGNIYVADTTNNRILKRSSSGAFLATWGTYGTGSGQFKSPTGVAVDTDGKVYVADRDNYRIQVGTPVTLAGTVTSPPASLTNQTSASLTLSGSGISQYKYRLDGGSWITVGSAATPISLSGLGSSSHTVDILVADTWGNWQTTPTSYTWTVDATPPTATVTTPPPSITNSRDITLNVVAGDVEAYKLSLDSAAFGAEIPVATPISLTNLADGDHTVAIIGRDTLGNWQSSATSYAFTVDTVAPVAVISGTPADPTNATSATLAISGLGVATYQYKLDTGSYQTAAATAVAITLTGLADGSHTVSVLGIDAAGNSQSQATPTTATWTVDTDAPVALVTGTPATPTNSAAATLAVSGEGVAAYKFKLDNGTYAAQAIPCGTDISLTNLADGGHVVSVIGGDAAGNWQSQATPTTVSWVVDTTAPIASLAGVPASPTNSRTAEITVGGDGVNLYQYKLGSAAYGPETDVATKIDLSNLPDGSQTLTVKGRDLVGNWQQTPTTATWIVDTDAPVAVLTGAPAGSTNATSASIAVSGEGVAAYRAKLDSAAFGDATDPAAPFAVSNLAEGSHTVAVIARDAAGNWQTTPTTATWTVDTTAPTPVLSGLPTGLVNVATATVTVSEVAEYQYKLDSDPWNPKTPGSTPITLTGLGNGSHTLAVIGCDSLGNCQSQAAPVTATWIVDTQAPAMPTIPAESNPARQAARCPTLVWTSVSEATDYLVELADNAGFDAPRVQRAVSGQTRCQLADNEALNKPGMWYWRVRARDAAGNVSTWASASFTYQANSLAHLLLLLQ